MKVSGIYLIINEISNKCYVGQSSNISVRWTKHRQMLSKNKHTCSPLQASYNKHGKEAFSFHILEVIDPCKVSLTIAEQFWMDSLKCLGVPLYNIAPLAGTSLGCVHSAEANKRKSERQRLLGYRPPSNLGKCHTEETKRKISTKLIGRVFSDETRAKMRKPHKKRV